MYEMGEGHDRVVVSFHEVKGVAERGRELVRQVVDPGEFKRTLSLSKRGVVYYIDHIPVGYFSGGAFELDPEVIRFFPAASVRAMRGYIEATWGAGASQGVFGFVDASGAVAEGV